MTNAELVRREVVLFLEGLALTPLWKHKIIYGDIILVRTLSGVMAKKQFRTAQEGWCSWEVESLDATKLTTAALWVKGTVDGESWTVTEENIRERP